MKTFYITHFKVVNVAKTVTDRRKRIYVLLSMTGESWSVFRQAEKHDHWLVGETVTVELVPARDDAEVQTDPSDDLPDLDANIEAVESDVEDSGLQLSWDGVDATSPVRVEVPYRYDAVAMAWGVEIAKRFVVESKSE